MANLSFLVFLPLLFPIFSLAITNIPCNGRCQPGDACAPGLICYYGICTDSRGTHICKGAPPSRVKDSAPAPSGRCNPVGTLKCRGTSYDTYTCSPKITSTTRATLTNTDFSKRGDGGRPSECDNSYHNNSEWVVALSTGWYHSGSRCGKMIRITASNGRSVTAKVVDVCDSIHGCDKEHAGQPPCKNNIVDGSDAVWSGLGLDKEVGVVDVTWSIA